MGQNLMAKDVKHRDITTPLPERRSDIREDPGMPPQLIYLAVVVGLVMIAGGLAMLNFMKDVPYPLPGLAFCVGFGLVLAAFGARAGGQWSGFALVGSA